MNGSAGDAPGLPGNPKLNDPPSGGIGGQVRVADFESRIDNRELYAGAVPARIDCRRHAKIGAGRAGAIRERGLPGVAQVPLFGEQRVTAPGVRRPMRRFAPHGDQAIGIGREAVQIHVRTQTLESV